jgi:hypothetical protein
MKYASYIKEVIGKHNKKKYCMFNKDKKNHDKKNIML